MYTPLKIREVSFVNLRNGEKFAILGKPFNEPFPCEELGEKYVKVNEMEYVCISTEVRLTTSGRPSKLLVESHGMMPPAEYQRFFGLLHT